MILWFLGHCPVRQGLRALQSSSWQTQRGLKVWHSRVPSAVAVPAPWGGKITTNEPQEEKTRTSTIFWKVLYQYLRFTRGGKCPQGVRWSHQPHMALAGEAVPGSELWKLPQGTARGWKLAINAINLQRPNSSWMEAAGRGEFLPIAQSSPAGKMCSFFLYKKPAYIVQAGEASTPAFSLTSLLDLSPTFSRNLKHTGFFLIL